MQKGGIVASGSTSQLSDEVIQRFLAVWFWRKARHGFGHGYTD
jgi:hypothetical protein